MIVKPPPHCGDLLSIFATGSIVCAILPKIVLAVSVGLIAAFLEVRGIVLLPTSNFAPFGALSIAISLFLGFRNNAAYARWWEGRRQLGVQLIAVRALGRASLLGGIDASRRRRLLTLVVEHCRVLRFQLRCDAPPLSASEGRLDAADIARLGQRANPADALLALCAELTQQIYADETNGVDSIMLVAINGQLDALGGVQGACERLKNTPLPNIYTLLVHRATFLYVLLSPFAMAKELRWYTCVFNAIVAYLFFGLEEVTTQMERPFGSNVHSLALDAITRNVEIAVADALGDEPPAPLEPKKNGLLM